MKEYSIMKDNPPYWRNKRYPGCHRHEIFEGRTGNRDKSIKDGLVIFVSPEYHRLIHKDYKNTWLPIKEIGEKTWCEYYNKTPDDFRIKYGRNYI